MSARLALVVSKRTPYIMFTTECCAGNGIGGAFLTCEHAARTWSTVATVVCGPNWTTIHCLSRAWSIFAQPVKPRVAIAATVATAATVRRHRDPDTVRDAGAEDGCCICFRTSPLYDE